MRNSLKLESVEKIQEQTDISRLEELAEGYNHLNYQPEARDDISIPLPLKYFERLGGNVKTEASVTLVGSDLHLGDTDHMPRTWLSTLATAVRILNIIKLLGFDIKVFNYVLNGDIVCGRDVFRNQNVRTLVPRGHWQVSLAEQVIGDSHRMLSKVFKVDHIYLLRGNHESAGPENYSLYTQKSLANNSEYKGQTFVLNVAKPLGEYNILFNHGRGSSSYYPVPYVMVRDIWKAIGQEAKGVKIERVCMGHVHWLTHDLQLEGVTFDVTGGFQRWERSISQRPSGMIMYLYTLGELAVIPVKPHPNVVRSEQDDSALEFKNLKYYAHNLLEVLSRVKSRDVL